MGQRQHNKEVRVALESQPLMQVRSRVRKWHIAAGGVALLTLALALGVKSGTPKTGPIRLAALNAPAESVRFDLISSGCFSFTRHVLEFRPSPIPQISVSELPERDIPNWDLVTRVLPAVPRPVATVTLSSQDVRGLDRLLQYYRTRPPGGCTNRDQLCVTRRAYGWKLRTESYFDDTCRIDLLADADPRDLKALGERADPVVSLDRLIGTASAAQQRGLQEVAYAPLPRFKTEAYQRLQYRQQESLEVTPSMLESRSQEVAAAGDAAAKP